MPRRHPAWLLATLSLVAPAAAITPRAETLLPPNAAFFVSVTDVPSLRQAWKETQMAKLLADAAMEAFRQDLGRQLREKWLPGGDELGVGWKEILDVASGEAALAILRPSDAAKATVLLIDVAGREDEAARLVNRLGEELIERGAKLRTEEWSGVRVAVYDLLQEKQKRFGQAVYLLHEGLLIIADRQSAAASIVQQIQSKGDALVDAPAYQFIQSEATDEIDAPPHLRWYLDPFSVAEVQRAVRGAPFFRDRDVMAILRNQGFGAIRAAGGGVYLGEEQRQVTHRTVVYAPGYDRNGAGFENAARALSFPNGDQRGAPSWTPRDIAGATAVNLNVRSAFQHIGSLIDEWYRVDENDDQPFFQHLLRDLALDPEGPQVDLEADVVAHLGSRGYVLSDVRIPSDGSELNADQIMVAIEAVDPAALEEAIRKLEGSDPNAEELIIDGVSVWKVAPANTAAPNRRRRRRGAPAARLPMQEPIQSSGVAVAHGHLMIASHFELLARVVEAESPPLSDSVDFQRVEAEISKLGGDATCVRSFVRRAEANRSNFILLRDGKMPQSRTIIGHLLNILLAPEDGSTREAQIDGALLPEYDVVQRYLGPGGCFVVSEEDGWKVVGFTLSKQ